MNAERAAGGSEADASAAGAGGVDGRTALTKDDLFDVLQNGRRRRVLRILRGATGPVDVRDVAERVAAWENGKPVDAVASQERQRAYIALYQSHLPKLDEAGAVDYERSRGVVERLPVADQFDPFLDAEFGSAVGEAATSDARLNDTVRYCGAATVLGAALTVASASDAVPSVPTGSVATAVTGLFVVVTALVAYERRR